MPGPSSSATQTRGTATAEERALFPYALQQTATSSEAAQGVLRDPRLALAVFDNEKTVLQQKITDAERRIKELSPRWAPPAVAERQALQMNLPTWKDQLTRLDASRPFLEQSAARVTEQEGFNQSVQNRLNQFISGQDLGISPQERDLITQGISGISQDVATSRGLNRTDVPVMQAIAPAVAQALLGQANANRSLFTGINQFQQGMDLSNRQLQLGLAGQNPGANLTGVFSGLRSAQSETQQNYGFGDYINMAGKLAAGAGGFMTGLGALGGSGGGGGQSFVQATGSYAPSPYFQTPYSSLR